MEAFCTCFRKKRQINIEPNKFDREVGYFLSVIHEASAEEESVQELDVDGKLRVLSSIDEAELPPAYGVHFSVLKKILDTLPESIDKAETTTGDVIRDVVKTNDKLAEMKVSWLDMLRSEDAHDDKGIPLHGEANVFISHTWRYNFQDTVDTVVAFAEEFERKEEKKCYIWMDLFLLNQFCTDSFDPNWLKETFTNVIKRIGLTVTVMTPFEDPASVKRVWCLWELYLSIRFSKLHIALPPDQVIRFQETLVADPYYVTSMMEQIDAIRAENAEAFDPNDKVMIDDAIEESIGFHELNKVVISALRQWIEDQCTAKIDAIRSGELDAEKALAAPTNHSGSGSTLFRAVTLRSTGLVRLSLLHPDVKHVVNGTSDSWPPFANSLSMGLCDITDELMDHPAFNFGSSHWQIDSYMIKEKNGHSYHPDFDLSVPHSRVEQTLRKFFDNRIAAGFDDFTYEKFVEASCNGTLPPGWSY